MVLDELGSPQGSWKSAGPDRIPDQPPKNFRRHAPEGARLADEDHHLNSMTNHINKLTKENVPFECLMTTNMKNEDLFLTQPHALRVEGV